MYALWNLFAPRKKWKNKGHIFNLRPEHFNMQIVNSSYLQVPQIYSEMGEVHADNETSARKL